MANSVAEGSSTYSSFIDGGSVQTSFEADRINVILEPKGSARFLVINERYDPRWKASSGDRDLVIYPTNVLMRGVLIPAGIDHVTLRYVPPTESTAAWICYGSAVALFLIVVASLRRLQTR